MAEKPPRKEPEPRLKTEEELRLSREKFQAIFEHSPLAIMYTDENGSITTCNENACRLFGAPREKLIGFSYNSIKNEKMKAAIASALDGRKSRFEGKYLTVTGNVLTQMNANFSPSFTADGKVAGVIGIFEDISERKKAEKALQESETKYKTLVQNIPGMVYQAYPNWSSEIISDCRKICGYSPDEINAMKEKWLSIVHPDDRKIISGQTEQLKSGETNITQSYRIIKKNGEIGWVEDRKTALFSDQGKLLAIDGIVLDISDRMKAEEELKTFHANMSSLLENTDDYILISDEQGLPVVFNSAYARVMKEALDIEMRPGLQSHKLLPDKDKVEWWDGLHNRVLSGEKFRVDYSHDFGGGNLRHFEVSYQPIFENGKVTGFSEVTRDITDRKNDEKNLVNSEERFRLLTESSREGVCIHDKGIILDVNSAFAAIFGYDRKELIGKKILDLAAPESRDLVRAKTLSGFDEPYEAMGITKDGSIIFGELHGKEIPYMGGKARVSSIRDLTKTRKMEQEVQKIHKLESIGILAGGIAHDFNNLLTAILGNISLAKIFAKDNAKVLERLGHAENASGRAQDLTQQLLTFSKGGAPIKRTASIADLIRDSASFILSGANVNCDLQIAGNLWPVSVDEGQISQVIQNLVKNADQAMPDGGTITILAENTEIDPKDSLPLQNGNYVKITIRDLGVGIMKKHLAKVFDPFFSTKQEGSGLGLAVAYSIIKKHDGLIMVESEPGHGTTFQIFLPASAEPVPSREPAKTDPSISGGRILIMDDEAAVLKVASSMLEIMGYKCAVASNGSDAVSLYRQAKNAGRPFDAVILDLTVPGGMGGRETLQQLKEIDPDVRSIVSSGYANDPIMADSADYGFMGVVEKPYDMRQLGDALRKLLG